MSLDAQDWVWQHSRSKGTARLVLLAIADRASGPACSAYAGTTYLVRRANAARSSVVVAVDRLLASGELEIVEGCMGPGGERCYRLPLAADHRRKTGGPKTGPVRDPDRSGNQTPGGPDSVPPRSGNRTPTGPKSGPQNASNAVNAEGTQRERSPKRRTSRHRTTPDPALSPIPEDWTPSDADRTKAAADITRLGNAAVAHATAKFIAHHRARGDIAADFGPLWVIWLARERPEPGPGQQGAFLVPLPGGRAPTPPTPTPPSYHDRIAQLDAIAAADREREGDTG